MDLFLQRTHYRLGTNGMLFHKSQFLCFCIELSWGQNHRTRSCIPDGIFELEAFYSPHFGHHFLLKNVPDRTGILIHPANDASSELQGSIAPVSQLTGIARGLGSRRALQNLILRTEAFREIGEPLFLTISSVHSGV